MTKPMSRLCLVFLSAALFACGKESSPPPASPEPVALSTKEPEPAEPMSPASGTLSPNDETPTTPESEAAPPRAAPALSDPEIAEVLLLANTAEVEQGKLAQKRAKHPKVKSFAAMMIADHDAAKKKLDKLALEPASSSLALDLKSDSENLLASLKGAAAADFDVTYVNAQVDVHRKVLAAINDQLIPSASAPELKSLLQEAQALVSAHLAHAEELKAELSATR